MVSGGSDDFDVFVAGVQRRLLRSSWLLTADWEDAEDLVQSCLAKVWRHWGRVRAADEPEAYVRRVLLNTFLSARQRRWRGERAAAGPEPASVDDPADDLALRNSLLAGLARLSPRQRAVVVLRYFDDLSEVEVARVMGCRPGTVKSTASKALEHLRAQPGLQALTMGVEP